MKVMKKILSLALCMCISVYTLPVFAFGFGTSVDNDSQRSMLNDFEMATLVGAGTVDAKISDYASGEVAQAVFANRTTLTSTYSLTETDANGSVLNTITSGSLPGGQAIIVSGPVTLPGGGYTLRATITTDSFAGITATDTFMQ